MKLIRLDAAFSRAAAYRSAPFTAGVYGLVDEAKPQRVRYVGVSEQMERRLHAHRNARGERPREQWIRGVEASGSRIAMVVLEEWIPGSLSPEEIAHRERHHITALSATGQADTNVRATPIGHQHSLDTPGKVRYAELLQLRAENALLKKRIAELEMRGFDLV